MSGKEIEEQKLKVKPQRQSRRQSSHDCGFLERGMSEEKGSLTRHHGWSVRMKVYSPAVGSLVLLHHAHCHPFPGGQRPSPAETCPLENRTQHCSLASFPAGCPGNPSNLILSDDEGLAGLMSQYLFIAQPAPCQSGMLMLTWVSDMPRWGCSPAALFPAAVEVEGSSPGEGAWMWVQSLSLTLT